MNTQNMTGVSLVYKNNHISLDFKNGKISDVTIFGEDGQILLAETIENIELIQEIIDFTLGFNFELSESTITTGLEPDRQEVE